MENKNNTMNDNEKTANQIVESMTLSDFCYWLQGLLASSTEGLSKEQKDEVKTKLELAMKTNRELMNEMLKFSEFFSEKSVRFMNPPYGGYSEGEKKYFPKLYSPRIDWLDFNFNDWSSY